MQSALQFQSKIGIARIRNLVVSLIFFFLCFHVGSSLSSVFQCKTSKRKKREEKVQYLICLSDSESSISKALICFGGRKGIGELVILSVAIEIVDLCFPHLF